MELVRVRIKHILLVVLGAAALAFMIGYRSEGFIAADGKTVIHVWQPFGGSEYEGVTAIVREFERTHNDCACDVVFMGNDVSRDQKFYMSVVGRCPPDVVFVPSDRVAEWAHRRLLSPLDDLLREAGRDPKEFREEFFEPLWRACTYRGQTYSVALNADPAFGLMWNKRKLREALASGDIPAGSIDPDKAPETTAQLDHFNDVVRKFDKEGRLVRVGATPFTSWSYDDVIYTWGWAFGGEFYDEATGKITANDPHVVRALQWLCDSARKCDIQKVKAMSTSGGKNGFVEGTYVMGIGTATWVTEFPKVAPDMIYGRDIGVAPMPVCPGQTEHSSWLSGWTLAIPAGVTDPVRRKNAMKFILWACASPEGTTWRLRGAVFIPGWRKAPYFEQANQDPRMSVYLDILKTARHYRPAIPIGTFMNHQLDRAGSKAIEAACEDQRTGKFNGLSEDAVQAILHDLAQRALDDATHNAQVYLDRFLQESPGPEAKESHESQH